jgi:hypothetical protein
MIYTNTNLPAKTSSEAQIKQFFDKFYINDVTFPAGEIDAVIGFFQRRDFDITSARTIAIVLLNQAKVDNVPVFSLLETLKSVPTMQISSIVAQVLNAYREKTSLVGYRVKITNNVYETRNILV